MCVDENLCDNLDEITCNSDQYYFVITIKKMKNVIQIAYYRKK